MNNNNNEMNLVPSSDDDRDWILDAYYIGYYKKNWLNPKIEYELPSRVILKLHLNSSNNISKYQCTIIFENNKWYISDGDMEKPSRNGTWYEQ